MKLMRRIPVDSQMQHRRIEPAGCLYHVFESMQAHSMHFASRRGRAATIVMGRLHFLPKNVASFNADERLRPRHPYEYVLVNAKATSEFHGVNATERGMAWDSG
jgi:hypothetical protein